MIFGSLLTKVKPRKIESERRSASKTSNLRIYLFTSIKGGGPRVVVSTAAFHARVRGSVPGLGGLKETKLFLPHPRVKLVLWGASVTER